jgi:hypothetical protein
VQILPCLPLRRNEICVIPAQAATEPVSGIVGERTLDAFDQCSLFALVHGRNRPFDLSPLSVSHMFILS